MNELNLTMPLVGKKMPDIAFDALVNNEIKKMKMSDFAGKWLLLVFYPGDFTFICPTELREVAALYPAFQKMNVEVIGVSTDSVYVHKAWHDSSKAIKEVNYPLAADPAAIISRALGVYLENDGVALRGTFIVDPDGIIKSAEVNDNSIGRSGAEMMRKVQAAQYVMTHPGEVCPMNWKPGEATLKPGLDLVGKI
jgi:peroxiredoxin (alkyl hydroperoxide reductase subunit C)